MANPNRKLQDQELLPNSDPLYLEQIVSEDRAAKLRGVSTDTLRRNAQRGEGPARLQLSARRVGYRLREVLGK